MSTNASLLLLIQFAYANHDNPMLGQFSPLPASQVIGGPAWINSEGYDITVKPGANTDPKLWWQMWQTLLTDRFKLKLHRETRDLPVYVLTAEERLQIAGGKAGRLCFFPSRHDAAVHPGEGRLWLCCGTGYRAGVVGLGIEGRKVRIADLSRQLALILDRPILDRTGFTGEFDLRLNFTPDGSLMGMPPGYGGPGDPTRPNIFAALEDHLGLQLTMATGPVEVLVIDYAERPTTN
jgi:uncharacterized protein (TIGR03435 family)